MDADTPEDTPGEWVLLADAAQAVGRSVSALRKRYQAGDLERRHDDTGRVLVDLEAVRRLYPEQAEAATGVDLVPLEILDQIRDLYREAAEARERAAVAETREAFAAERRREAEARVAELEAQLEAERNRPGWWRRIFGA